MTTVQSTIPFKCRKPHNILGSCTKINIISPSKEKVNLLNEASVSCKRSIMGIKPRRSPRKRLGLGVSYSQEDLFTNEDVLDAIFKLSPHSPIKRTKETAFKSSLATTVKSVSNPGIKSPTRLLLSPIRALSLNSPPNSNENGAVEKANKKRAQILQNKLQSSTNATPIKQKSKGKKLQLEFGEDETPVKPSVNRRITRSSKKKANNKLQDDLYDDYKENDDPNSKTIWKPSPKKRPCILNLEPFKSMAVVTPKSTKSPRGILKSSIALNFDNNKDVSPIKAQKHVIIDTEQDTKTPNKSKRYLKLCKQNCEVYQKTKNAFHTSAPKELTGREREIKEISSHINQVISKESSGSLYISGAPGTGKSACLNQILANKKVTKDSIVININCMSCQNSAGIYTKIATELGASKRECRNGRVSMNYVESTMTTDGPTIILLLDEMDQLDSKNQEILYTMFEWPALQNSRVMLIGIANSLDLTDRILPRLQLRVECKPTLINFKPYSKDQIASILENRITMANEDELSSRVIDAAAVQFCARKVAAVAGDARKALDICRRAVEVVEGNIANQAILSPVSRDKAPSKVGLPQIASVLNKVYESNITTSNSKGEEEGLPLQQKIAICTLILLTRSLKCKVVTMGKFHEAYMKVCKNRQVTGVGQSEFLSMLQLIESRGIVSIKGSKQIRQTKVNLSLQERDVEYALQDKTLLTDILMKGLPC